MEQADRGRRLASASSLLITDLPRHIESSAQITAATGAGKSKTSSGPAIKPTKNGGSRSFEEVTAATTVQLQVASVVVVSIDGRTADDLQVCETTAEGASCTVASRVASPTDGGKQACGLWMKGGLKKGASSTVTGQGRGLIRHRRSVVGAKLRHTKGAGG